MREELYAAIKGRIEALCINGAGEYYERPDDVDADDADDVDADADDELYRRAIRHVDLWNHNVEFIEQEDAWARPAVFVEFGPIEWEPFKCGCYRGRGNVVIHTVTDWMEGRHDRAFALSDAVVGALDGLCGAGFSGLTLLQTQTNHNHEDILENLDTFTVRYLREL